MKFRGNILYLHEELLTIHKKEDRNANADKTTITVVYRVTAPHSHPPSRGFGATLSGAMRVDRLAPTYSE